MTIEKNNEKSVASFCYPAGEHDNIQYHFFCGDLVFSARIFRTESLEKHFFWLYDGEVKELVNSSEKLYQEGIDHLQVKSSSLMIVAEKTKGFLSVYSGSEIIINITFKVNDSFTYLPTRQTEPVTHLPNLECTVFYQNKRLEGTGYCKRYFGKYPDYWEYRFIHCVSPPFTVWAADAFFGKNKYNYFHLLADNKELISSLNEDSYVINDTAHGLILNEDCEVFFEIIVSWHTRLHSQVMDSLLQQYYCKATLKYKNKTITGLCLNEVCAGSLA
jgi:hypothetical protein